MPGSSPPHPTQQQWLAFPWLFCHIFAMCRRWGWPQCARTVISHVCKSIKCIKQVQCMKLGSTLGIPFLYGVCMSHVGTLSDSVSSLWALRHDNLKIWYYSLFSWKKRLHNVRIVLVLRVLRTSDCCWKKGQGPEAMAEENLHAETCGEVFPKANRAQSRFKVTVNNIWSKFSKIHFLALYLGKAFKFNLLKTKLQNLKNNARYAGKSVLWELERKSERCHIQIPKISCGRVPSASAPQWN